MSLLDQAAAGMFLFAVAKGVRRNWPQWSNPLGWFVSIRCREVRTAEPCAKYQYFAYGKFLFAVAKGVQRNAGVPGSLRRVPAKFLFAVAKGVQRNLVLHQ